MKKVLKDMFWWMVLAFSMGFIIHIGGQVSERVWPRQPIEFKETISVYHHYNFNSVTQEWDETDRTSD